MVQVLGGVIFSNVENHEFAFLLWDLGTPPRFYMPSLHHLSPKTWELYVKTRDFLTLGKMTPPKTQTMKVVWS